ncbi:transcription factor E2-alpha-like, partial [Carlito syrichta]|uniref:Transcription factor E2-alpha-like n=1 Tax=Carlito syrichta TaxID=1868482 RepID=A0A3Q0DHQ3_CARSF
MNQPQRMAPVGTDKELSDLLDFSMMFPLPVANGKGRPAALAGTQFGGPGLEARPGPGSWGASDQDGDASRTYGDGAHFGEPPGSLSSSTFPGPGLGGKSGERSAYAPFGRETGGGSLTQPGASAGPGRAPHLSLPTGSRGTTAGSSGDALGKALASIYSPDHSSNNFSSSPSTPVGSPQGLAGSPEEVAPGQSSKAIACDQAQNKMEDHLDEAIHVLRSHAVGTTGDLHGLLPSHGALASGFAGSVALAGRPAGLVGGGHSEDGLAGSAGLMHNHATLPSQPGALPDLSRPPDSYS